MLPKKLILMEYITRNWIFVFIIISAILFVALKFDTMFLIAFLACLSLLPVFSIYLYNNVTNGILFWLFLLLFSAGFQKMQFGSLPNLTPDRIIFSVLTLIIVLKILTSRDYKLTISTIEILMIFFTGICLISMLRAGNLFDTQDSFAIGNFVNGFIMPFLTYAIAKRFLKSENDIRLTLFFLTLVCAYLTLTAVAEHYNFNAFIFPKYIADKNFGSYEYWGRARGPFVQSAVNSSVIGIVLFVSIAYISLYYQKIKNIAIFSILILSIVAIFFTYTRASWISLVAALFIASLFIKKYRMLLLIFYLGLSCIGVVLLFLYWDSMLGALGRAVEDLQPIYDRVNLYKLSYQMFLDKPIMGFGFETFQKYSPTYFNEISGIRFTGTKLAAHDTFVAILVELGIIGLITYIWILFLIIKRSFTCFLKTTREINKLKILIICFWAASIHYFINLVFIDIRYFTFLNSIWFIFAAIVENKTLIMSEQNVSDSDQI